MEEAPFSDQLDALGTRHQAQLPLPKLPPPHGPILLRTCDRVTALPHSRLLDTESTPDGLSVQKSIGGP